MASVINAVRAIAAGQAGAALCLAGDNYDVAGHSRTGVLLDELQGRRRDGQRVHALAERQLNRRVDRDVLRAVAWSHRCHDRP